MSSSNLTSTVPAANDNNNLFVVQLQLISQYLSITLCFIIFIAGTIGNLLNILIFVNLKNYRHNPCSLYMLAGSITDTIFAVIGLVTRALSDGFQIDFTVRSQVWCKLRPYILITSSLCTFSFIWLQSIDAYFASSRSPIWRQKSNVRTARYFIIAFIFFWILHNLPYLFFENLIGSSNGALPKCVITNTVFYQYHTYFLNLGVTLIFSLMIITVFGFLTYRNLRALQVRELHSLSSLTKQMIRMVLAQTIIVFLCQGSYTITQTYFLATASLVKSDSLRAKEKVVTTIFSVYIYVIHTVNNFYVIKNLLYCFHSLFQSAFYCYYLSSERFREQAASIVKRVIRRTNNQLTPSIQMRHMASRLTQTITPITL